MKITLHAYKDGTALLVETDAQRRTVWDRGALPLAEFTSLDAAQPVVNQFTDLGGDGLYYLKAALDKRELTLDDLFAVRADIGRFRS